MYEYKHKRIRRLYRFSCVSHPPFIGVLSPNTKNHKPRRNRLYIRFKIEHQFREKPSNQITFHLSLVLPSPSHRMPSIILSPCIDISPCLILSPGIHISLCLILTLSFILSPSLILSLSLVLSPRLILSLSLIVSLSLILPSVSSFFLPVSPFRLVSSFLPASYFRPASSFRPLPPLTLMLCNRLRGVKDLNLTIAVLKVGPLKCPINSGSSILSASYPDSAFY